MIPKGIKAAMKILGGRQAGGPIEAIASLANAAGIDPIEKLASTLEGASLDATREMERGIREGQDLNVDLPFSEYTARLRRGPRQPYPDSGMTDLSSRADSSNLSLMDKFKMFTNMRPRGDLPSPGPKREGHYKYPTGPANIRP